MSSPANRSGPDGWVIFGILVIAVWLGGLGIWIWALRSEVSVPTASLSTVVQPLTAKPGFPTAKFEEVYERGQSIKELHVQNAKYYRLVLTYLDWTAFGITSLITLIATLTGIRPPQVITPATTAAGATDPPPKNGRRWIFLLLGLLAALASIAVGCSTKVKSAADWHQEKAIQTHDALAQARRDFVQAPTPEDAERVIEDLEKALLSLE